MSKRLFQLLAENRAQALKGGAQSKIVQAEGSDEATIYLYDPIVSDKLEAEYWGGVCAQDFVPQIAAITAKTIHLRINSPGGDVFAGQTIAAALERHSAKVIGHIDGLAASAATGVACACDEIVMSSGAFYMIHNAWTFAMGNRHDLQSTVGLLEKVDGVMADNYAESSGQTKEQCAAWMDAETWFTAEEAVANGFASSIEDGKSVSNKWNLAAYANAPKAFIAPPPEEDKTQYAADDHRIRQQQRLELAKRTQSL